MVPPPDKKNPALKSSPQNYFEYTANTIKSKRKVVLEGNIGVHIYIYMYAHTWHVQADIVTAEIVARAVCLAKLEFEVDRTTEALLYAEKKKETALFPCGLWAQARAEGSRSAGF